MCTDVATVTYTVNPRPSDPTNPVDGIACSSDATGATLSAFDLESDEIAIKVSANGKAKINVEKNLSADVSTGGYVSYKGNPAVKDINTSIGGKVEKYTE